MFCSYCGKEIKEESQYCKYCGKKIVKNKTIVEAEVRKKTNLKKNALVFWGIFSICILVVCFGMFFGVRIAVIKVMESKLEIVRNNSDSYDEIDIILDRKDDEDIETDCPVENEGLQEDLNIEEESYKEEIIAASEKTKELEEIKEYEEEEENEELENDNSKRYILPNSDSIYLTEKDLRDFSAEECRFARNEIYARHGRKFNDEELQAYFDRQDWYRGRIDPDDFTEDMLNEYELYNRDFIVEFEEKQGYR